MRTAEALSPGDRIVVHDGRLYRLLPVPEFEGVAIESLEDFTKRAATRPGIPGVNWRERDKRWRVTVGGGKRQRYVGQYKTYEEAVTARKDAEQAYWGQEGRPKVAPALG